MLFYYNGKVHVHQGLLLIFCVHVHVHMGARVGQYWDIVTDAICYYSLHDNATSMSHNPLWLHLVLPTSLNIFTSQWLYEYNYTDCASDNIDIRVEGLETASRERISGVTN